MQLDSVDALLERQLKELYDAEVRLTESLPTLATAASSAELRMALENHVAVTRNHVERLRDAFQSLGLQPSGKTCLGMKGLIAEGEESANSDGNDPFTDLAIIGACRRVEHYEAAAYMSTLTLTDLMGQETVSELLRQNLEEEQEADQDLASLAEELLEDEDGEEEVPDEEMEEDEIAEDQRL